MIDMKTNCPMPFKASLIRMTDTDCEPLYASAIMKLKLRFAEPVDAGRKLQIYCYTSDWKWMALSERTVSLACRNLSFRFLHPDKIWLSGAYRAVLSCDGEPYAQLLFRYEGRVITSCECHPLAPLEDAYWIVSRLEREENNHWGYLREFRGLSDMLPKLIRLSRLKGFDRLCKEHGTNGLRLNTCFSIAAPSLLESRHLAYLLPNFLDLDDISRVQIDCSDREKWATDAVNETFVNREGKLFVVYNLSVLMEADGTRLLNKLKKVITDRTFFSLFFLCGTIEEVETFFRFSPELVSFFKEDNRFYIQSPTWKEIVYHVTDLVQDDSLSFSVQAEHAFALQMQALGEAGKLSSWTYKNAGDFISKSLLPRVQKRLKDKFMEWGTVSADTFGVIMPEDLDMEGYLQSFLCVDTPVNNFRQCFEESMQPLYDMVGLDVLKKDLESLFYQVCFNRQRKLLHLPSDTEGTYHMIFTGNPGTGKTTVAKWIGKIFHAMGLLSKGEVIVTERTQLLGRYIGETEKNMQDLLKLARGNVLFIDEAYTLCDTLDDRKDFGNHVIESLLTVLAEPHPDMLVIMAGYENEMERLMQMNQGLKGRFPYTFRFEDYKADELQEIARRFLSDRGYKLREEAMVRLQEVVENALADKDRYFSNARWIKQFFTSGVFPAMAMRVMCQEKESTKDDYEYIRVEDIDSAALKFKRQASPVLLPKRRIGFIA